MRLQGLCITFLQLILSFGLVAAESGKKQDSIPFVPRFIDLVEPEYPSKVSKACINADVVLEIELNGRGEVNKAKAISCSVPKMGFENSAVKAVKKSIFLPLYFFSESPRWTKIVHYTMKFRCYNGLVPTTVRDSAKGDALIPDDSLPDEIRNLDYDNWCWTRLITLYPLDSSTASSVPESDIWIKFQQDVHGQIFRPKVVFATTDDTVYKSIALNLLTEGNLLEELPWLKKSDSRYIRIAIRKNKPFPQKNEHDSSFVPPDTLSTYPMEYPSQALELGQRGKIRILALIEKDGSVLKATFQRSSGYYALDYAAVQAAHLHTYKPAMMNDTTIRIWVNYEVKFTY